MLAQVNWDGKKARKRAYGGVVIDPFERVLLRLAPDRRRGAGGWTFAKGKPKAGEAPHETALREVWEETGVKARILARIPGRFTGARKSTEYFVMIPLEQTGRFDRETQRVAWVERPEAADLIRRSRKSRRKDRDLLVLAAAFEVFNAHFAGEARMVAGFVA